MLLSKEDFMKPKISVLFSTYNESISELCQSIKSVLIQSFRNFEFIIVIDNPKNEKILQCVENYRKKDNRIIIVKNKENIGLVNSLNKGIKYTKGDYIARMDADDICHPKRFEKQIAYLQKNNLDLIGCNANIILNNKIIGQYKKPSFSSGVNFYLKNAFASCLIHPTWFGKKEVFEKLNGYNTVIAAEDYEFLLRAYKAKFKIGNINQTLLDYRIREQSISISQSYNQCFSTLLCKKEILGLNCLERWHFNKIKSVDKNKLAKSKSYISLFRQKKIEKKWCKSIWYLLLTLKTCPHFFINKVINNIFLYISKCLFH